MFLALPAHILRTLPLLAMIPLFQVWFGVSFIGTFLFVAYGIGVIFFAGTINAIGNVPPLYIENARTLGASPYQIYRTVILPAVFPELRTTIILSLGVAWSAVVGAEFLGAQTGLGFIEVQARQFALLDRMVVVALFFLVYAAASYLVFELASRPLVRWMPRAARL
jgi:sulfonate transport system permease protein